MLEDRSGEDRNMILERINHAFKTEDAVHNVQRALAVLCGDSV